MMIRLFSFAAAALALFFLSNLASFTASANVIGSDMQNFNPITSGLDFVTVQSSETLKPGVVNLGLFLNYAVNTLPYFQDSPQGVTNFNDEVLGLDLNAGLGLMKNWDIGFSAPQILNQNVHDTSSARGEFAQTGSTEFRLNSKVRLLGDDSYGVAVIGTVNFNQVEDNPWIGRNAGPTFDAEVAADTTVGKIAYAANVGYRFRNPGTAIPNAVIQPLGNQIIASVAASYLVTDWNTKFIGEIFGSAPGQSSNDDGNRSLESLEALAGIKHDINTNLAFHAGGGAGLIQGVASPNWRVYTGINYTFGPLWGGEEVYVDRPTPVGSHLEQIIPAPQSPRSCASASGAFPHPGDSV